MSEKLSGSCINCQGPCSRRARRCGQCIADRAAQKRMCPSCGGPRDRHHEGMCQACRLANLPSPYPESLVAKVRHRYLVLGQTQVEVAAALGITQKVVMSVMRRHDIPRRRQVPRYQRGSMGHGYRPDATNYKTLHSRVAAQRGKPRWCVLCGGTGAERYEWANLTGRYEDIYDYVRMCVPCHRRFDANRRRAAV